LDYSRDHYGKFFRLRLGISAERAEKDDSGAGGKESKKFLAKISNRGTSSPTFLQDLFFKLTFYIRYDIIYRMSSLIGKA